ncbi:hypothetical protein ACIO13_24715 [Streptomyces sp. NPDC087425]|uniref:hypothetical protein n=1 Tax=Streptomyces sp. NPDC087425 TaxID=3365787 RepID=UPI003812AAD5
MNPHVLRDGWWRTTTPPPPPLPRPFLPAHAVPAVGADELRVRRLMIAAISRWGHWW